MYTILMKSDKSLVTTKKETIYQREKLVDKIRILIPKIYNEIDLSEFICVMIYNDQVGNPHTEQLICQEELYKEHLVFTLPVDTCITKYEGDVTFNLIFSKVDVEMNKQYVLRTGDASIQINPFNERFNITIDEQLGFIEKIVGALDARLAEAEEIAELYDSTRVDNISVDENFNLQLEANGNKIGRKIPIVVPRINDTEDGENDGMFELDEYLSSGGCDCGCDHAIIEL